MDLEDFITKQELLDKQVLSCLSNIDQLKSKQRFLGMSGFQIAKKIRKMGSQKSSPARQNS